MTRTELEMEFAGAALGWVEGELEMTDPEIGQTLDVDRKKNVAGANADVCSH